MRINKEMLVRYREKKAPGLYDPCIICGGKLPVSVIRDGLIVPAPGREPHELCGHDIDDTSAVLKTIKALSPEQIDAIFDADDQDEWMHEGW